MLFVIKEEPKSQHCIFLRSIIHIFPFVAVLSMENDLNPPYHYISDIEVWSFVKVRKETEFWYFRARIPSAAKNEEVYGATDFSQAHFWP